MGLTIQNEAKKKEPTKIITRFVQVRDKCIGLGVRIWNGDSRQALTLALVYFLLPMSFVLELLKRAGWGWYFLASVICVTYYVEFWIGSKNKKRKR